MRATTERWWAWVGLSGLCITACFYFSCGFFYLGVLEACDRFETPVSRTDALKSKPPNMLRHWWPHLPSDATDLVEQHDLDTNWAAIVFRLPEGIPCPWRSDLARSASRWPFGGESHSWPADLNRRLAAAAGPGFVVYELHSDSGREVWAINCERREVAGWQPH